MKIDAIVIKPADNVATALRDIAAEEAATVSIGENRQQVKVIENVAFGHKFAVLDIPKGDNILKYGEVIGRATQSIKQGAHAHIQNIESLRGRGDLE